MRHKNDGATVSASLQLASARANNSGVAAAATIRHDAAWNLNHIDHAVLPPFVGRLLAPKLLILSVLCV